MISVVSGDTLVLQFPADVVNRPAPAVGRCAGGPARFQAGPFCLLLGSMAATRAGLAPAGRGELPIRS